MLVSVGFSNFSCNINFSEHYGPVCRGCIFYKIILPDVSFGCERGPPLLWNNMSYKCIGFEVLTAMVVKSSAFWYMPLYGPLKRLHGGISQKR
jgi:hypothetical protein